MKGFLCVVLAVFLALAASSVERCDASSLSEEVEDGSSLSKEVEDVSALSEEEVESSLEEEDSGEIDSPLKFREGSQDLKNTLTRDDLLGGYSDDDDDGEDTASLQNVQSRFEYFVKKYNKVYLSSQERERRMEIFAKNLKRYEEMNAADTGTATYGVDQFSDMSVDEFKQKMLTLDAAAYKKSTANYKVYDGPELYKKQPRNFNWADKGKVTAVKNQGFCGSCWAFSAVGNMEGLYAIKHNQLKYFSEQQIVDCDKESEGCNGGWMSNAVDYVKKSDGLQEDSTYPYTGHTEECKANSSLAVCKVKENVMLPQNEKKMTAYLFKNGPISAALDATAMMGYKGGIAHPPETACKKGEEYVNHGILLVGYGVYSAQVGGRRKRLPYWIIKNSWGTSFGRKGYYLLYRGDGSCAIHTYPSSAVLK